MKYRIRIFIGVGLFAYAEVIDAELIKLIKASKIDISFLYRDTWYVCDIATVPVEVFISIDAEASITF